MEGTLITNRPVTFSNYIRLVRKQSYLLGSFAKRNLREIYSGNIYGFLTSFLQPLITLVFFSVFFGLLIKIQTPGVKYPLYAFSGMIIWNLFAMSFMDVMSSLNKYGSVITKLYFPRIIIPVSALANSLLVAVVSYLLLILACLIMETPISGWIAMFPLFMIMTVIFSFSLGLYFSYKSVKNRKLLHILPGIIGFGSWLTPIFYPVSLIPEPYTWMIFLNPLSCITEFFRWSIFGSEIPSLYILLILILPLILLVVSVSFFIRKERMIADYI